MKFVFATILALLAILGPTAAFAETSKDISMGQVDGIASKVVDELWKQTDTYWHAGDSNRIIALDRIIVKIDPNFVPCYVTGAWLMESAGNNRDAEAFYQQAVQNNPSASLAYYNLGFFYYQTLHDYAAAAYTFREGAKQPDADLNDWKMLAHSYERNHNLNLAVTTWGYIKNRWPDGAAVDVNYRRIMAYAAAAQTPPVTPSTKQQ